MFQVKILALIQTQGQEFAVRLLSPQDLDQLAAPLTDERVGIQLVFRQPSESRFPAIHDSLTHRRMHPRIVILQQPDQGRPLSLG